MMGYPLAINISSLTGLRDRVLNALIAGESRPDLSALLMELSKLGERLAAH